MTTVFAVANQMCGVAKTTTVHSLGSALAAESNISDECTQPATNYAEALSSTATPCVTPWATPC